jgi:hypothetical protein
MRPELRSTHFQRPSRIRSSSGAILRLRPRCAEHVTKRTNAILENLSSRSASSIHHDLSFWAATRYNLVNFANPQPAAIAGDSLEGEHLAKRFRCACPGESGSQRLEDEVDKQRTIDEPVTFVPWWERPAVQSDDADEPRLTADRRSPSGATSTLPTHG